jgi:YgiT-type zinc finger domain-containing protein
MKSCFYCKGPLRTLRIEHMHRCGARYCLIKNVRADVCKQCGEAFLPPASLKAIDRVVANGQPLCRIAVPVHDLRALTPPLSRG